MNSWHGSIVPSQATQAGSGDADLSGVERRRRRRGSCDRGFDRWSTLREALRRVASPVPERSGPDASGQVGTLAWAERRFNPTQPPPRPVNYRTFRGFHHRSRACRLGDSPWRCRKGEGSASPIMGNSWSSEPPPPVTLWVRVKEQGEEEEEEEEDDVDSSHARPNQRVIEVPLNRRTTFCQVKQMLSEDFNVFPGMRPDQWRLSVSGMDGNPNMFAFAKKTAEPDVNAYLYEVGIEEAAELIASVPSAAVE